MIERTHLSLFSGIGGLDLAADMAGFRTVGQCEWADYPTKILEKHWPDVPRWRDIRTLTKESFHERTGLRTVDVISGGFPCQPFSVAGQRKGRGDDRFLWPEMLRVIRELRPTWVIGENVGGLVSMAERVGRPTVEGRTVGRYPDEDHYDAVLVQQEKMLLVEILEDIRALGYDVQPFVIPACAVGAPHRRDRIAIVARNHDRKPVGQPEPLHPQPGTGERPDTQPCGVRKDDAAHANGQRRGSRRAELAGQQRKAEAAGSGDDVAHAYQSNVEARRADGVGDREPTQSFACYDSALAHTNSEPGPSRPEQPIQRQPPQAARSGKCSEDVANTDCIREGNGRERQGLHDWKRYCPKKKCRRLHIKHGSGSDGKDVQHAYRERCKEFYTPGIPARAGFSDRGCTGDAANAKRPGLEERDRKGMGEPEQHPESQQAGRPRFGRQYQPGSAQWAIEPAVGRVAHGVPHRVDSLKCLGNAVVPQWGYPYFEAIMSVEKGTAC